MENADVHHSRRNRSLHCSCYYRHRKTAQFHHFPKITMIVENKLIADGNKKIEIIIIPHNPKTTIKIQPIAWKNPTSEDKHSIVRHIVPDGIQLSVYDWSVSCFGHH